MAYYDIVHIKGILMVYVGIWLLFGIFSAMLASGKNRSVAGWFFIGALFGPFGLLVAAMPTVEEGAIEGEKHPNKINDATLICVTEDNNDWETAKSQLRDKFASQGFELEAVDNEESYMLKKSPIDNEYVMLQQKNGAIYIEFNRVPEVELPLAKQYQERLNQEEEEVEIESHTIASIADEIEKLHTLKEKSIITDDEFQAHKKRLLA